MTNCSFLSGLTEAGTGHSLHRQWPLTKWVQYTNTTVNLAIGSGKLGESMYSHQQNAVLPKHGLMFIWCCGGVSLESMVSNKASNGGLFALWGLKSQSLWTTFMVFSVTWSIHASLQHRISWTPRACITVFQWQYARAWNKNIRRKDQLQSSGQVSQLATFSAFLVATKYVLLLMTAIAREK